MLNEKWLSIVQSAREKGENGIGGPSTITGKYSICTYSQLYLTSYIVKITKGMSEQHSTDLGAVKHTGLTYLMLNHEPLEPPISKKGDKLDCGFNHLQIAQMLCPHKKLTLFNEDPDM